MAGVAGSFGKGLKADALLGVSSNFSRSEMRLRTCPAVVFAWQALYFHSECMLIGGVLKELMRITEGLNF